MMEKLCFLLILIPYVAKGDGAHGWGYYDGHGEDPSHWSEYSNVCDLSRQSPIDIEESIVEEDPALGELTLVGYDTVPDGATFVQSNNGHTVAVGANHAASISIEGGGLDARYDFVQFHVHWGKNNSQGSEHTLNGRKYPAEIHFVHKRSDITNISAAMGDPSGLAVLGVLVEIVDDDHPALMAVQAMHKESSSSLPAFILGNLLPENRKKFFRYKGSLTTPPCSEAVIWTVFEETIKVNQPQIDIFRQVYGSRSSDERQWRLGDNFRPVQALNGRRITTPMVNEATTSTPSFARGLSYSLAMTFIALYGLPMLR